MPAARSEMFERTRIRLRMNILPAALSNVEAALRAQLNQSILKCARVRPRASPPLHVNSERVL